MSKSIHQYKIHNFCFGSLISSRGTAVAIEGGLTSETAGHAAGAAAIRAIERQAGHSGRLGTPAPGCSAGSLHLRLRVPVHVASVVLQRGHRVVRVVVRGKGVLHGRGLLKVVGGVDLRGSHCGELI